MNITFTWYVPDTLTITDPDMQGPLVGTRNGVEGVIVSIPWALKGVAEDGTTEVTAMVTPIAVPSLPPQSPAEGEARPIEQLDTFKPFEAVMESDLKTWLFSAPDGTGSLSKADQEAQLTKRILDRAAPTFVAKLGAPPVPPNKTPEDN